MKRILLPILLTLNLSLIAQETLIVYFETNQFELTKSEYNKLKQSAKNLQSNQISVQIQIKGYADYVGDSKYNQNLSLKRAESVKKSFLENGIDSLAFSGIEGVGSTMCNHSSSNSKGCADHRKVDIIYTFIKKPSVEKNEKIEQNIPPEVPPTKEVVSDLTETIKNMEAGNTLLLNNIQFVGGSDVWLEESVPALENLIETMQENSTLKIEIQGHICCDTQDRNDLSTRRAFAIYNLLIQNGIEKNRLKYKGYGRKRPLKNNPEETKNRRVEILILEK